MNTKEMPQTFYTFTTYLALIDTVFKTNNKFKLKVISSNSPASQEIEINSSYPNNNVFTEFNIKTADIVVWTLELYKEDNTQVYRGRLELVYNDKDKKLTILKFKEDSDSGTHIGLNLEKNDFNFTFEIFGSID
ncbi:hypothetical protein QE177_14865 (plasmid) [Arsenophonus sp. aPb]|uniref:hypothetical protein n=1 Tax=Arsenophonus sp. aPb TaxID=3041619 RepID=UPI0024693717|nr:hypothetical protein [Arsenophonus sp. aPb]WGL99864.1 hypothetical protein QE177_15325 [Arsenophonus sp. aPb]WGL99866.1 hypothetical protein QE177_14865 [Arsenophonus sp. aPb]